MNRHLEEVFLASVILLICSKYWSIRGCNRKLKSSFVNLLPCISFYDKLY
jgi:hypothetical protein